MTRRMIASWALGEFQEGEGYDKQYELLHDMFVDIQSSILSQRAVLQMT